MGSPVASLLKLLKTGMPCERQSYVHVRNRLVVYNSNVKVEPHPGGWGKPESAILIYLF